MLWRIVHKEVLEHLMSLRFAIACVLCFIVILSSLFVRCRDFSQSLDDYHENRAIEDSARKAMEHPWQIVYDGVRVHQAPNPLKTFVRGVEDEVSLSVRMNARDEPEIVAAEVHNPPALLFPAMDMVSFVGIIMSLLAIVFGYDAICGEKERGTLRLMLSYSVPRDKVLLGKWIGGYVALVAPFLLATISGAVIVLVQPGVSLGGGDWLRLLTAIFVALLFIAATYSAAVYVSCLTSLSSTSVMILVTFWMVLVLAVPNLAPYLAQAWLPAPNPAEARDAKAKAREEVEKREVQGKMDAWDRAHGLDPSISLRRQLDWSKESDRAKMAERRKYDIECRLSATLETLKAVARIDGATTRALDRQTAVGRWLSRVSPYSSLSTAMTELTDTGELGRRRFFEQIAQYQETVARYGFEEWAALQQKAIETGEWRIDWTPDVRQKPFPTFIYTPPAATDHLKSVALDVLLIAAAAVVFFMLSFVAFLRYDVR